MSSIENAAIVRGVREDAGYTGAVAAADELFRGDDVEHESIRSRAPGCKGTRASIVAVLLTVIVALCLLGGMIPGAGASSEWCEVDPLVVIVTPGGSAVPVYVNIRAQGYEHAATLEFSEISYTTQSTDGGTATIVRMTVRVPRDLFSDRYPVQIVVSTGPARTGTTLASAKGYSEQDLKLQFKLSVA
jgi:hypothetical protein